MNGHRCFKPKTATWAMFLICVFCAGIAVTTSITGTSSRGPDDVSSQRTVTKAGTPLRVGVIKTDRADKWVEILREAGAVDVQITTVEKSALVGLDVLVLPGGWRLESAEELQSLRQFTEWGGRLIAAADAGFKEGKGEFLLTPLLDVGWAPRAYSVMMMYPSKSLINWNSERLLHWSKYSLERGVQGIGLYSFVALDCPLFLGSDRAKRPPLYAPVKEAFFLAETWCKGGAKEFFIPTGAPDMSKLIWLRSWMLYRNAGKSVEELVDICHDLGANIIVFGITEEKQGVQSYHSNLPIVPGFDNNQLEMPLAIKEGRYSEAGDPMSPIQLDWLERMIARCRQYGIRLWIGSFMRWHCPTYYILYPQDRGVGLEGAPLEPYCHRRAQRLLQPHLSNRLKDLFTRFPYISGLVLDEPALYVRAPERHWRSAGNECFCPECKAAFKEFSGQELTEESAFEKISATTFKSLYRQDPDHEKMKWMKSARRTPVYNDFLIQTMAEHVASYVGFLDQLERRQKPVLGACDWFGYDVSNSKVVRALARSGVQVFVPYVASSAVCIPDQLDEYTLQRFPFSIMIDNRVDAPLQPLPVTGTACKMNIYNNAEIIYWCGDGIYRYPGIVRSVAGHVYLAFDPMEIDNATGKTVLTEALRLLEK